MRTRLVLVRHGVTEHTTTKRFSGGLSGANPPLSDEGRAQIEAALSLIGPVDAILASPVRRTRESADIAAASWGLPVHEVAGFAEMDFGLWEGRPMQEVMQEQPAEFMAFFSDPEQVAGETGESLAMVRHRVLAARDEVQETHRGQTVAVFSHVTPIKMLIADALGAPADAAYRMELAPACVSVLRYDHDRDGNVRRGVLESFNAQPLR